MSCLFLSRNTEDGNGAPGVAAEQGSVLLLNQNNVLPLDAKVIKSVAVVGPFGDGPNAKTAMKGGYSPGGIPRGGDVVTVAAAFRARGFDTTYEVGVGGGVGEQTGHAQLTTRLARSTDNSAPFSAGALAKKEDIAGAVGAAVKADVAVVVIGTMACGCCKRCATGVKIESQTQHYALPLCVTATTPTLWL
jgi:hypothetical protein